MAKSETNFFRKCAETQGVDWAWIVRGFPVLTGDDPRHIEHVITQVACEAKYVIQRMSMNAAKVVREYLLVFACLSAKTKLRLVEARIRKLQREAAGKK